MFLQMYHGAPIWNLIFFFINDISPGFYWDCQPSTFDSEVLRFKWRMSGWESREQRTWSVSDRSRRRNTRLNNENSKKLGKNILISQPSLLLAEYTFLNDVQYLETLFIVRTDEFFKIAINHRLYLFIFGKSFTNKPFLQVWEKKIIRRS